MKYSLQEFLGVDKDAYNIIKVRGLMYVYFLPIHLTAM